MYSYQKPHMGAQNHNHPMTMNLSVPVQNQKPNVNHYYGPRLAPTEPRWLNNDRMLGILADIYEQSNYDKNSGYFINRYGILDFNLNTNGESAPGCIAAAPFYMSDDGKIHTTHAHIMNTEDAGLRYVMYNNGVVNDIGPVEHACIIGNETRPEGIYVPFSNIKAICDASVVLDKYIKSYANGQIKLDKPNGNDNDNFCRDYCEPNSCDGYFNGSCPRMIPVK